MARRYLTDKLIHRNNIKEEIRLIDGTQIEYITPSGKIYTDYGNDLFYPKKTFINKNNGYLYVNINMSDGTVAQRRVHRLVALAYIPNPDPNIYNVVMHIDNDKSNPDISNLKWGTISENTQDAHNDGLVQNDRGFNDSQSMPVAQFDLDKKFIKSYGSARIAEKLTGITLAGILYQCHHKIKTKPRKGYYFRFLSEYKEKGFVL